MNKKHTIIAAALILLTALSVLAWQKKNQDEDLRVLDVYAGRTTYDTLIPIGSALVGEILEPNSELVEKCVQQLKKEFEDVSLFESRIQIENHNFQAQLAFCAAYRLPTDKGNFRSAPNQFEIIKLTPQEQSILKLGLIAALFERNPQARPEEIILCTGGSEEVATANILIPLAFAEGQVFQVREPRTCGGTRGFVLANELGYEPAAIQTGITPWRGLTLD